MSWGWVDLIPSQIRNLSNDDLYAAIQEVDDTDEWTTEVAAYAFNLLSELFRRKDTHQI